MKKDFDRWNGKKKTLHKEGKEPFFHEREIWWCALGVNIGFEQDGTGRNFDRPILIIKGFNRQTCFCVALTGKKKEGKYYFYLGEVERLVKKISTLDEHTFLLIKAKMSEVLFGSENSLPPLARGRGRGHL